MDILAYLFSENFTRKIGLKATSVCEPRETQNFGLSVSAFFYTGNKIKNMITMNGRNSGRIFSIAPDDVVRSSVDLSVEAGGIAIADTLNVGLQQ